MIEILTIALTPHIWTLSWTHRLAEVGIIIWRETRAHSLCKITTIKEILIDIWTECGTLLWTKALMIMIMILILIKPILNGFVEEMI